MNHRWPQLVAADPPLPGTVFVRRQLFPMPRALRRVWSRGLRFSGNWLRPCRDLSHPDRSVPGESRIRSVPGQHDGLFKLLARFRTPLQRGESHSQRTMTGSIIGACVCITCELLTRILESRQSHESTAQVVKRERIVGPESHNSFESCGSVLPQGHLPFDSSQLR